MDIRFSKEAFIKLEGETVYLKKLSKELLDDYYLALESTSVDTDIYTGTTHKYVKSQIENYIQRNEVDKSRIDFIIFSKEDDKMVGEVIISNADPVSRNAGLRIAIFNYLDFNKGYGSEGLVLSMGYGFGMMNLHRIEMEVYDYNERGLHVYERIGFKKEGVRREAGFFNHRYHDMIVMSMLEDEFRTYYVNNIE